MNKLTIQVSLFASAIILLSSCNKQASIALTKRHYRSGYYVDFGTKNHVNNNSKVIASNKKEEYKPLPLETTKSENLFVADPLLVGSEKFAKAKKTIEAKKIATSKNEVATYNCHEQNTIISDPSIANNLSEGTTATKDEVTVYVVNVPFVVILLCAIFIPPLGVGLMYGLNIYFWIDLLLTLLFFIPGLIFALVVVLM